MCPTLSPYTPRRNFRQRNYAEVSTQLHGAVGVVAEFQKFRSIPQIRELMARCPAVPLSSLVSFLSLPDLPFPPLYSPPFPFIFSLPLPIFTPYNNDACGDFLIFL